MNSWRQFEFKFIRSNKCFFFFLVYKRVFIIFKSKFYDWSLVTRANLNNTTYYYFGVTIYHTIAWSQMGYHWLRMVLCLIPENEFYKEAYRIQNPGAASLRSNQHTKYIELQKIIFNKTSSNYFFEVPL